MKLPVKNSLLLAVCYAIHVQICNILEDVLSILGLGGRSHLVLHNEIL